MKLFFTLLFMSLAFTSYAMDITTCQLKTSGIPKETRVGQSYSNLYECTHHYLPVQLSAQVMGRIDDTSLEGSCLTQTIDKDQACQMVLTYAPKTAGQHLFYLRVWIGKRGKGFYIELPQVISHAQLDPDQPVIVWEGKDSGQAHINQEGNGSGHFIADAKVKDSPESAIVYTYTLNGEGKVGSGPHPGDIILKEVTVEHPILKITAYAKNNEALPSESKAIEISTDASFK